MFESAFNYSISAFFSFSPLFNGVLKCGVGILNSLVGAGVIRRLVRRGTIRGPLLLVGGLCMAASLLSACSTDRAILFFPFSVCFLLINSLNLPLHQALLTTNKANLPVGELMGLFNAFRSIGQVAGSMVSGFSYTVGHAHPAKRSGTRTAASNGEKRMVKRILCFGDSNTYGYIPGGNGRRYGPDVRWTGLLSAWLKPECLIIEEGLPGRTTVFEDPILPGRKGSDYFYPCLWSHAPLDMLLLMLGTNDCKMRFGASAKNIASGMEALVRMAISTPVWAATPKVLLISPPPMTPKCFDETSGEEPGSICSEKSCQLAPLYEKAAERLGCAFLDAGVKVQVSGIDGTHMDEIAHFTMATAVMSRIRQLFQPEKEKR